MRFRRPHQRVSSVRAKASIASRLNVRDDAYAPLAEAGWRTVAHFLIIVKINLSDLQKIFPRSHRQRNRLRRAAAKLTFM
jgi:hypothetical protein